MLLNCSRDEWHKLRYFTTFMLSMLKAFIFALVINFSFKLPCVSSTFGIFKHANSLTSLPQFLQLTFQVCDQVFLLILCYGKVFAHFLSFLHVSDHQKLIQYQIKITSVNTQSSYKTMISFVNGETCLALCGKSISPC